MGHDLLTCRIGEGVEDRGREGIGSLRKNEIKGKKKKEERYAKNTSKTNHYTISIADLSIRGNLIGPNDRDFFVWNLQGPSGESHSNEEGGSININGSDV